MLGPQYLLRFAAFAVLVWSAFGHSPALSQEAARTVSVEQLTAMLQAIDPYRPIAETSETIQVYGSTSMDALAHGWATGFKQFHAKAQVEITAAGTEEAMSHLAKNPSAIAMYSRPVTEEELSSLKQQGLKKPMAFMVAREALSVFVHATNPAVTISREQLRDVFTTDSQPGELKWSHLGAVGAWANQPIHIIARTENSGTQKFLSDFVFQGATVRPSLLAFPSNAEVLQALQKDPLAIAICGYRSNGSQIKALRIISGATAIPCDDHAILCGQYPLTRPMSLVIDMGQTDKKAIASQEFVRYALCQAGQTQAMLVGLFPVDLPLLRAGMEKLEPQNLR